MSVFHEAIKQTLRDVDKFLNSTLKDESLDKSAQKERGKILQSLQKLYEEYEVLNPHLDDEGSNSSKCLADESRFTTGSSHSHGSHGSEEDGCVDNIPDTTMKALEDPIKRGYLQKKPTDLLEKLSKQTKYCVIHKNIMYWFKKPADKKQQGAIFLTGYEWKNLTQNDKEIIFELSSSKKKSFQFQVDNRDDLEEWRKAIETGAKFVDQKQAPKEMEEDEFEDIGDTYEAIEDVAKAVKKSSTMTSATKPTPTLINLPPLPSTPQPLEPASPQDVYDDAMSMPALPKAANTSKKPNDNIITTSNEEFDDDMIYEFVEAPPASSDSGEMRSSIPVGLPPRPPQASAAAPPLPSRGVKMSAPASASPALSAKKRCPTLDEVMLLEDYQNLFYGIWSCVGDSTNELSFNRGDIVHVLNRDLDGADWWIGESGGNVGLVPKGYLSPAYQIAA